MQLIEGAVSIKVPANWTEHQYPFSSCLDIGEGYFGRVKDRQLDFVFIEGLNISMRRKPHKSISDIYAVEREVLKAKNRNLKIVSIIINKQANSLTIDYIGHFYDDKPPFFFQYKLIINEDEWVTFYFRGVDTPALRNTVDQVGQTIIVNSIPVMKRRKPCREVQI